MDTIWTPRLFEQEKGMSRGQRNIPTSFHIVWSGRLDLNQRPLHPEGMA
jgi:hypothetical protein